MTDDSTQWKALVEADCGISSVPGETEEDAREFLKETVDTGDLGPIRIVAIMEDT